MKEANDVTILVCIANERAEIESELAPLKEKFGLKIERLVGSEGQWCVLGSLLSEGFAGLDKRAALDEALKVVGAQLEVGAQLGRVEGYKLMGRLYKN